MLARVMAWLRKTAPSSQTRPERRRRAKADRKALKRRQRWITAGLTPAQGDWSTPAAGLGLSGDGAGDGGGGGAGGGGGDGA